MQECYLLMYAVEHNLGNTIVENMFCNDNDNAVRMTGGSCTRKQYASRIQIFYMCAGQI